MIFNKKNCFTNHSFIINGLNMTQSSKLRILFSIFSCFNLSVYCMYYCYYQSYAGAFTLCRHILRNLIKQLMFYWLFYWLYYMIHSKFLLPALVCVCVVSELSHAGAPSLHGDLLQRDRKRLVVCERQEVHSNNKVT